MPSKDPVTMPKKMAISAQSVQTYDELVSNPTEKKH